MKKTLIPLGIFLVLVVFLAIGLTRKPHEIPSPLINKPAPAFNAPVLGNASMQMSDKDMLGQVWLLNVWASWCAACREEHPLLLDLARAKVLPIIGLDYKDKDPEGLKWLARFGNPYALTVTDSDGRIGINFGVYGVPESFLIDKQGVIRFKQIGPFTPSDIQNKLLPLIRELQR